MNVQLSMVPGLVLLAGSALAGYSAIFVPAQNKVQYIQHQIAAEKENQQAQASMVGLIQELEKISQVLPQSPDPSWISNEVVVLAQQSGVQFTSVMQNEPKTGPGYVHLSVSFDFSATYHQLGSLLDKIENSKNFIWLERLDMVAPEEGIAFSKGQLVLSTLYLQPTEEIVKKAAMGM